MVAYASTWVTMVACVSATKDYGSYVYNTHTAAAEPMTGKTTTRYVRRRDFAICENDDITSIAAAATVASRYD